jgi:tRNA-splicing ligase RtcB
MNPAEQTETISELNRSPLESSRALADHRGSVRRHAAGATAEPLRPEGKLVQISAGEGPAPRTLQILDRIAQLPFVDSVLALPDVHWKDRMEVPSSIAITTRDVIVPEFASMDVNDGMGVMKTSLREEEMSSERMIDFFARVNANAATHFLDTNRYSISASELRRVLVHGARALLSRYEFDDSLLSKIQGGGQVALPGLHEKALADLVPLGLLLAPVGRREMGLNFGGNHFLEVQVVDEILDREIAARWGFERGQVVVMYHLGPGPLGGALLHHAARREKLRRERAPLFFLSKLLFHYAQRAGTGSFSKKWGLYFRKNGWTPTPVDSEEGLFLRQAFAMATNYGYGYRMATMRAIADGIHGAVSASVACDLFCDVSHNSLLHERVDGRSAWVARHNACQLEVGSPAIIAGSCDVPSYLGIGDEGATDRFHTYDHGAGHLIEGEREQGRLAATEDAVMRIRMTRGRRGRLVARGEIPGRSSKPIDQLMESFQRLGMIQSVLKLRPIGNFKN